MFTIYFIAGMIIGLIFPYMLGLILNGLNVDRFAKAIRNNKAWNIYSTACVWIGALLGLLYWGIFVF